MATGKAKSLLFDSPIKSYSSDIDDITVNSLYWLDGAKSTTTGVTGMGGSFLMTIVNSSANRRVQLLFGVTSDNFKYRRYKIDTGWTAFISAID